VEKVKSLSTADKIMMNAKGKEHVEIDCFIKFMFITNNETNFIYVTDEDIRYWIVKVPVLKEENPNMLDLMIEEIPAFLSFLNRRKLQTEKLNRMWFHPSLIKTEALKKVVAFSKSTIEKELRQYFKDAFLDFGVDEILMTRKDIHKEVFNNRYEANYLEKVLKEELRLDTFTV
jgi:phage/plasmid-associated DNA primase